MTHTESLMLALCFGAVMGSFIGNIIMLIKIAVDDHKEKKRRRAEEAKAQEE
jgi:hypothetical protein